MKKFRWSKVYESSEEELTDFLEARGLTPKRYSVQAHDELALPATEAEITLWCAEGSFSLSTTDGTISMQPGDALRIPAATSCTLRVGMSGCVYYGG